MDYQHRHIKGYRELSPAEISLMNAIKEQGVHLEETLNAVDSFITADNEEHGTPDAEARRWLAIARTQLQQGLMAATRAVARPNFF